jgi:hypothetical protein
VKREKTRPRTSSDRLGRQGEHSGQGDPARTKEEGRVRLQKLTAKKKRHGEKEKEKR